MNALTLALMAAAVTPACCQTGGKSASCTRAEARQFDFWVGEWDVQVHGQVVAHSSIRKLLDGCIVREQWMPFGGGDGQSWNYFRGATGKWEQVWVTNSGEVLEVSGGWRDGAIREQGTVRKSDGGTAIHRHSFTPVAPDRVRQFCEESGDGGKTWHVVFDGLYIPREKP